MTGSRDQVMLPPERDMASTISYNRFWCLPSWSFLRCIKFIYTYKENDPWANSISMGQIRPAPAYDALDCPVCTGQYPVPRLERPTNRPLSRKLRAPWLKFTRLSGESAANGHLCQRSTITASEASEGHKLSATLGRTRMSGVPPDCPVRHKDRRIQWSTALNPNGQLTWQDRTINRRMSGAPVDRKLQPTARIVVGAINTPKPPPFNASKLSTLHTQ
jgi:hypothetical protein